MVQLADLRDDRERERGRIQRGEPAPAGEVDPNDRLDAAREALKEATLEPLPETGRSGGKRTAGFDALEIVGKVVEIASMFTGAGNILGEVFGTATAGALGKSALGEIGGKVADGLTAVGDAPGKLLSEAGVATLGSNTPHPALAESATTGGFGGALADFGRQTLGAMADPIGFGLEKFGAPETLQGAVGDFQNKDIGGLITRGLDATGIDSKLLEGAAAFADIATGRGGFGEFLERTEEGLDLEGGLQPFEMNTFQQVAHGLGQFGRIVTAKGLGPGVDEVEARVSNAQLTAATGRGVRAQRLRNQGRLLATRAAGMAPGKSRETFLTNEIDLIRETEGDGVARAVLMAVGSYPLSLQGDVSDQFEDYPLLAQTMLMSDESLTALMGDPDYLKRAEGATLRRNGAEIGEMFNAIEAELESTHPKELEAARANGYTPDDLTSLMQFVPDHMRSIELADGNTAHLSHIVDGLVAHHDIAAGFGFTSDEQATRDLEKQRLAIAKESNIILRGQVRGELADEAAAHRLNFLSAKQLGDYDAAILANDHETANTILAAGLKADAAKRKVATDAEKARVTAEAKVTAEQVKGANFQFGGERTVGDVLGDDAPEGTAGEKNFFGRKGPDGPEIQNPNTGEWIPAPGAIEIAKPGGTTALGDVSTARLRAKEEFAHAAATRDLDLEIEQTKTMLNKVVEMGQGGVGLSSAIGLMGGSFLKTFGRVELGESFADLLTDADIHALQNLRVDLFQARQRAIEPITGEGGKKVSDVELKIAGRATGLDDRFATPEKILGGAISLLSTQMARRDQSAIRGGLPVEYNLETEDGADDLFIALQADAGFRPEEANDLVELLRVVRRKYVQTGGKITYVEAGQEVRN